MKNKEIKVGDVVSLNLEVYSEVSGYDSVEDMLPYFATKKADDFAINGGTFKVVGISNEGVLDGGESWTNFILMQDINSGVFMDDFLGSKDIQDWDTIEALGGSKNTGYIFAEDWMLNLIKTSEQLKKEEDEQESLFQSKMNAFQEFSEIHQLNSIWSIYEVDLEEEHNLNGVNTLSYEHHWGQKIVSLPFCGKTWGDVYKIADSLISMSGDTHHVFIESFLDKGDGVFDLSTGS